jgi:hypothetical protein
MTLVLLALAGIGRALAAPGSAAVLLQRTTPCGVALRHMLDIPQYGVLIPQCSISWRCEDRSGVLRFYRVLRKEPPMMHKLILATALLPLLGGAALARDGGGHVGHSAARSGPSMSQSAATVDHSSSSGRQQMAQQSPNHYSGAPEVKPAA